MEKTNSHKNMVQGRMHEGQLDLVQRYAQRFQLVIDTLTNPEVYVPEEGHMIYFPDGDPLAWVRGQVWRPQEQPIPQRSDISRFHPDSRARNEQFNPFHTEMGLELEPTIFNDTTGAMVPASAREDLRQQLQATLSALHTGTSPELFAGTWELDLGHGINQDERQVLMIKSLAALVDTAEAQGAHVIPLSALPHQTHESDVTNHPYIRRMALQVEGFDRAKWFGVMSSQMHWEIDGDWNTAFQVINLFQQITPPLFAASLAGNIAMDSMHPNPIAFHRMDEALQKMIHLSPELISVMDTSQWLSCRPWLRLFGSTSSGPLEQPLPHDIIDFYRSAETKLRSGKMPTPAREPGPHKDFRPRFDLNTIEACFFDTFGGNIDQLAAFQTFAGVLFSKLWFAVKNGDVATVRQRFPRLFGIDEGQNPFGHILENTFLVAQEGAAASITSADGTRQSVTSLFAELLHFANEPFSDEKNGIHFTGISENVLKVVSHAIHIPSEEEITQFGNGIPSARFFYETGIGTLAHSIQARVAFLENQGMNPKDIIENVKQDVGESFHDHVKSFKQR